MYYFSYLATLEGIPVVFAGGNEGPDWFSLSNGVPWVLTVASSTIDRAFRSIISLGNGTEIIGVFF